MPRVVSKQASLLLYEHHKWDSHTICYFTILWIGSSWHHKYL